MLCRSGARAVHPRADELKHLKVGLQRLGVVGELSLEEAALESQ
jgi:hypothetical protein